MRIVRSVGKVLLWTAVSAAGLLFLFLAVSYVAEYRPRPCETLFVSDTPGTLPDTLTVVTWNIGYGGLGDDMDFFYDGGSRMRGTKARTEANLARIIATLRAIDADVMLLQEVDSGSRRSYGLREVERLRRAFPGYTLTFAFNYNAWWVPIPPGEPMGRVRSGMVMLSRVAPVDALRYRYPSGFPFPERMFNLKRGLLAARFLTQGGDTVLVANTHNTAYDRGNMRGEEMLFLRGLLQRYYAAGIRSLTGGDWNQLPPGYEPSPEELSNPWFVPQPVADTLFRTPWHFVYDTLRPSLRFLDRPYGEGNVTTLTDFFLLSGGVRALSVETLPEEFAASDHNPVVARIALSPCR